MPNPYWLKEAELDEIKGSHGQKPVAAQMFEAQHRTPHLVVLYEDGYTETAHPVHSRVTVEATYRAELLQQKARRLEIEPLPLRRARGPRCLHCEFPHRLCLCFLLENERKLAGIRQGSIS